MAKSDIHLSPELIRAIELILMEGSTAEVRLSENGVSVTRIYRKKVFPN